MASGFIVMIPKPPGAVLILSLQKDNFTTVLSPIMVFFCEKNIESGPHVQSTKQMKLSPVGLSIINTPSKLVLACAHEFFRGHDMLILNHEFTGHVLDNNAYSKENKH